MNEEKKYLSTLQKLGYGLGDMGSNCFYAIVTTFLMAYLTDTAGLNAGIIGTLIMVSKILDGVTDILFGKILDGTHTKMGKARPWVLWSSIPLAVCLVMLFAVPTSFSVTAQYIYIFLTYLAANALCYTANNIAYNTLTALATTSKSERVSMGAFRYPFAVLTNIVVAVAVVPMVNAFGGGMAAWRTVAIILAIVEVVCNVIAVFSVKELPEDILYQETQKETKAEETKLSLLDLFKVILRNKYYLLMLAIQLLVTMMSAFSSASTWYFCTWQMGDAGLIGTFSIVALAMIVGIAVSPALVKKFGMYKVNLASYVIVTLFSVLTVFAGYAKSVPFLLVTMLFKSIAMGPLTGSVNALVAEVATYVRHKDKLSIEGSIYSCVSVGIKVGSGLGTAIVGWLLALGKYDGLAAVQTASALQMINISYLILPLACAVLQTICLWKMDVEKQNAAFLPKA